MEMVDEGRYLYMHDVHALFCSCLADFGMTMAEGSDADASGKVQDTATIVKGDVGATAFYYDGIACEAT
jgi:hypothetical protein